MPILDGADPAALGLGAQRLAEGGLVAFATETVYGLGARADDDAAVARIFAAKGRPADHPLIVHVDGPDAAHAFALAVPATALCLMRVFWPGPVTVIVPRRPGIADAAAAGLPTIGLRCPDHPVARALIGQAHALGVPGVAAPSANRFGRVSPTRAEHVAAEFGPELLVLDGGACREGIESSIVDCTRDAPRLLRPGTVGRDGLEAALGCPLLGRDAAAPRTSGTLESHYAPVALVRLVDAGEIAARPGALGDGRVGVYSRARPDGLAADRHRPMPDNPRDVAHELFAVLRHFDADGVREIWVERPPLHADWDGVRDRLQRAATR